MLKSDRSKISINQKYWLLKNCTFTFALISPRKNLSIENFLCMGKIGVYVLHNSVFKIELAPTGQEIQGRSKRSESDERPNIYIP